MGPHLRDPGFFKSKKSNQTSCSSAAPNHCAPWCGPLRWSQQDQCLFLPLWSSSDTSHVCCFRLTVPESLLKMPSHVYWPSRHTYTHWIPLGQTLPSTLPCSHALTGDTCLLVHFSAWWKKLHLTVSPKWLFTLPPGIKLPWGIHIRGSALWYCARGLKLPFLWCLIAMASLQDDSSGSRLPPPPIGKHSDTTSKCSLITA